ncbi:MAG: hypothetical protein HZA62_16245 [Rhodocyclales bacterium]|nr:hypothetical protein [Rhodocyclales bacterium]
MKARYLIPLAMFLSSGAIAEDNRQLARLSPEARAALRQEMLDLLAALNVILAAASEFATAPRGDRERALALLPNLTASAVGCHAADRMR